MMATAAVIGLCAGKRILSSSFYSSDLADKVFPIMDHGSSQFSSASTKNVIVAKGSSHFSTNVPTNMLVPIKALKEHVDSIAPMASDRCFEIERSDLLEDDDPNLESSLEVFLMLQKSMLEKQWKLSFNRMQEGCKKAEIISSGISARKRRASSRKKCPNLNAYIRFMDKRKQLRSTVSPELLQTRLTGYVRGIVSEELLTHAEVVHLSKKIKAGLSLEEHKAKMQEKLGTEPSDKQVAVSLRMSHAELRSKLIECSFAREKLAMSCWGITGSLTS